MEENKIEANAMEQTKNNKKKKKVKVWIIILIAVVVSLIVLAGVLISKVTEMISGIGMGVEVTEALKGSISQTVSTSGSVASEEVKTYFANVSASVDAIHVQPGQEVNAGDMLLAYDLQELEKAVAQAELDTKISTYGADAAIVGIDNAQKKAAEATVNYEDAKK